MLGHFRALLRLGIEHIGQRPQVQIGRSAASLCHGKHGLVGHQRKHNVITLNATLIVERLFESKP